MKVRDIVVTLVALVAIGVTCFFAFRYEQRREVRGLCPFCDRTVHPVSAFRLKDRGHEITVCCPRCGIHAKLNQPQAKADAAWATDVDTGESIAAESATYVEGGDVQHCTHGDQPMAREPHGVSVREYDRCLPALVAFKTHQGAEAYQQQHGGRVLSYTQAVISVGQQ